MFAHVDADSFFASVLQRKYPKLKGKPLLALGMGGGCVIAASYEAKRKGVKTGMRLRDAKKLVPDAIAMPADFRATYDATRQLFALFEKFCPSGVERASPDEGYLDLSCAYHNVRHAERNESRPSAVGGQDGRVEPKHLANEEMMSKTSRRASTSSFDSFADGELAQDSAQHDVSYALAQKIQSEASIFLDLPISIGIAPTKTLAKMGSKHRKPKGICIIEKDTIGNFLQENDVGSIPGIGWKSTPKMKTLGLVTAFDFAHADPFIIEKILGKIGRELQKEVKGEPVYAVITDPPPPQSISRCRSFRATNNSNFLFAEMMTHLQRCSTKLRLHGLECARLGLWIRGADYKSGASAERVIGRYIAEESLLMPFVKEAFEEMIPSSRGVALYTPVTTSIPCHTEEPRACRGASRSAPAGKQPEKNLNYSAPFDKLRARCASRQDRCAILPQRDMYFTQAGLILSDFRPKGCRQISLFEESGSWEETVALQSALDTLRKRYGVESVRYGGAVLPN